MSVTKSDIGQICFDIAASKSVLAIREALRTAAVTLGATYFMLLVRGTRANEPVQIILSNYPKDWQRRYDASNAWEIDPIMQRALLFEAPFKWDGLFITARQKDLLAESTRHGMIHGVTASVRGAGSSAAILCFTGRDQIVYNTAQWDKMSSTIVILTLAAQWATEQLLRESGNKQQKVRPLTLSERLCVEMIASGKTTDQVADALGVKARTVRYYLDRVAEKLGSSCPREAVTAAIANQMADARVYPAPKFGQELNN